MQQPSRWNGLAMLCVTAAAMSWTVMSAPAPGITPAPGTAVALDAAVAQLQAEAADLDTLTQPQHPAVFRRPHPALKSLNPDDAAAILERMTRPFTGNAYRDAYIRWHLIYLVMQTDGQTLEKGRAQIRRLVNAMPPAADIAMRPERRYEPPEIAAEYWKLSDQTATTVGYPPFQRTYHGRAALEHMSAARRAQMEPVVERMEVLRKQFRAIVDRDAVAFNDRIRRLDWLVRQYRGELVYVLLLTGDSGAPADVVTLIRNAVQKKDRAAFDMLSFVYKAALDGLFNRYQSPDLAALQRGLTPLAQSLTTFDQYANGSIVLDSGRGLRNFHDYVFHLLNLLEGDPQRYLGRSDLTLTFEDDMPEPGGAPQGGEPQRITPEQLNVPMIRAATQRAVDALYKIEPNWTFRGRFDSGWQDRQEIINETGNHALASWAMLTSGQFYQMPQLRRRINWVLIKDTPYIYDRAMRVQMLAQMPPGMWDPYIQRDVDWLTHAMTDQGAFTAEAYQPHPAGSGDRANSQYGSMALWAAEQVGVPVSQKTWQMIDQYWRTTQDEKSGGWSVSSGEGGRNEFGRKVTGPMTAGGVAVLSATERALLGDRFVELSRQPRLPNLQAGLNWLDKNFSLDSEEAVNDFYYYMWTIQQVGLASGYRTFNNIDWYRQVTARLLNTQRADGTWTGAQGTMLSTGFALLYLARANDPLPIAKVRFGEAWHNRPHDLYNFVQWLGRECEVPMFWQIVDPELPVHELIESPMLYMASDQSFELNTQQIAGLRRYLDAGGLLLMNPEGRSRAFAASAAQLLRQLYGDDAKFERLANDHWIYNMHFEVRPTITMSAFGNGVRPLVVLFDNDLSRDLQANDAMASDAFRLLANWYVYVSGKMVTRSRLDTRYVTEPAVEPTRTLNVVRLKHQGRYDPEPGALRRLSKLTTMGQKLALNVETLTPEQLTDQPMAYMTTGGDSALSDEQIAAIRRWLERGGTLWLDAAGGGREALEDVGAIARRLSPGEPVHRMRESDPIISGEGLAGGYDCRRPEYRLMTLQRMNASPPPQLQTVDIDGRHAVIFSYDDLTSGWAGLNHWGIFGYSPESAVELATNGLLQVMSGRE